MLVHICIGFAVLFVGVFGYMFACLCYVSIIVRFVFPLLLCTAQYTQCIVHRVVLGLHAVSCIQRRP